MTDTPDLPASCRDDARLLLADLAVICGTLSEIATVWRRAGPYLPGLPVILPERLHDAARELTAGIQALADAGPGQCPDPPLHAADRFRGLEQDIAAARAMTCGAGIADVGDRGLWQSLSGPLHRAGTRLTALRPHLITASG
jgi:hypothetical protein